MTANPLPDHNIFSFNRQLILSHQLSLLKSLDEEEDGAMALHLVLVLLFHQETKSIVHIPGRFIPTMISFLHDRLPMNIYEKLSECQHLISVQWKLQQSTDHKIKSKENTDAAIAKDENITESSIHKLIHDLKKFVMKNNS